MRYRRSPHDNVKEKKIVVKIFKIFITGSLTRAANNPLTFCQIRTATCVRSTKSFWKLSVAPRSFLRLKIHSLDYLDHTGDSLVKIVRKLVAIVKKN